MNNFNYNPRHREIALVRYNKNASKIRRSLWFKIIIYAVIGVLFASFLQSFVIQGFYVPSSSMNPTLKVNDRLAVEKWNKWQGDSPKRGDIIVFKDPGNWLSTEGNAPNTAWEKLLHKFKFSPQNRYLVKRVIAVGGDKISCCGSGGKLTLNGKALNENSYLPSNVAPSSIDFSATVPPGKLWVMGDNRGDSEDSRYHMTDNITSGFVDQNDVVGRVIFIIWPFTRIHLTP